mmetsp:Transcript_40557/g.107112  ORF Transcript_40557/g.107112 Transcript_40557/m.107112 type:complete len:291 (+) Transcript_40557:284-1156(+)
MPISRIAATQSARPAGPSSSLQLCSSALLSTAARSLVVAASSVVDALPQQREEQLLVRRRQLRLGRALQQGEDARAQLDGDAHDDALGDALDGSGARVEGGLVEMVGRLLEGREREDRLRHLGHAEARDAEDLATEGHHVSEEGHVAHVNVHAVVAHHVLDLVDDRRPRGLDSEALLHLHHVGRLGLCALDALDAHDRLQRRPLDQQPLARPAGGLLGGRLLGRCVLGRCLLFRRLILSQTSSWAVFLLRLVEREEIRDLVTVANRDEWENRWTCLRRRRVDGARIDARE